MEDAGERGEGRERTQGEEARCGGDSDLVSKAQASKHILNS